jgi:GGDEF domain-containing protein
VVTPGGLRDDAARGRDAAASARDRAGDLRDLVTVQRDAVADTRDAAGGRRDQDGERRDADGDLRDHIARQRDDIAEEEDRSGDGISPHILFRSQRARRDAASDRRLASQDRHAAAAARTEAERDRDAGASERVEAEHDRDACASDRTEAEADRGAASADRGASANDRVCSSLDELTGAYRRAAGFVELEREIARVQGTGQPLALLSVAVETVDTATDWRDRGARDRFLLEVAGAIAANSRPYDLIIRAGRDAFVCAFAGLDRANATKRVARLCRGLDDSPDHGPLVTRVAELQPGDSRDDLLERLGAGTPPTPALS